MCVDVGVGGFGCVFLQWYTAAVSSPKEKGGSGLSSPKDKIVVPVSPQTMGSSCEWEKRDASQKGGETALQHGSLAFSGKSQVCERVRETETHTHTDTRETQLQTQERHRD